MHLPRPCQTWAPWCSQFIKGCGCTRWLDFYKSVKKHVVSRCVRFWVPCDGEPKFLAASARVTLQASAGGTRQAPSVAWLSPSTWPSARGDRRRGEQARGLFRGHDTEVAASTSPTPGGSQRGPRRSWPQRGHGPGFCRVAGALPKTGATQKMEPGPHPLRCHPLGDCLKPLGTTWLRGPLSPRLCLGR